MRTLDSWGVLGVQVGFVVAALMPIAQVLLYRWIQVPARRAEISEVMTAAFGRKGDPSATPDQKLARQALERNPYISDLEISFDRTHSWWRYLGPVLVLGTLIAVVSLVIYAWVRIQLQPAWAGGPISGLPIPIVMALAGGYVWSVYQIVSRIRGDELGPADLSEINLGILASVPVGYAFSLLTLEAKGLPAFGAFAASAFPLREVSRLFQEQTLRKTLGTESNRPARPSERHLGTAIDGISDQTLVRLAELRIVTVLDMAYSDPIKVMLQTGYALQLVIDWMDQSIWALYAGERRGELVKDGLRCSLDVYEFVELHGLVDPDTGMRREPQDRDREALNMLAGKMGTDPSLLHDLFLRIYADPQVIVLRRLWYVNDAPATLRA